MLRNEAISETYLLKEGLNNLDSRLPPGWTARRVEQKPVPGPNRTSYRPDAMIEIRAPDGNSATVLVEAKRTVEPRQLPEAIWQLQRFVEFLPKPTEAPQPNFPNASGVPMTFLVIAPFIGSRARELLKERQCGYADLTGNLWLCISRPGLFIETSGATKDPNRLERPLQSLKGPASGRAVRALCEFKPPLGVREMAKRSGLPISTLSRVIDVLAREALIERDSKGTVLKIDWDRTIRRWAEDYSFMKSNRVRTFLDARGTSALREKLIDAPWTYAVTGSLAASLVAPVSATRLAQIYVRDADVAADALELRSAEVGANVMLAEPYSEVVFERTARRDEITCAALPQVAVDLMTSPGLGPKEADALLDWMAQNPDAWRT